jgi:hypothetical protein
MQAHARCLVLAALDASCSPAARAPAPGGGPPAATLASLFPTERGLAWHYQIRDQDGALATGRILNRAVARDGARVVLTQRWGDANATFVVDAAGVALGGARPDSSSLPRPAGADPIYLLKGALAAGATWRGAIAFQHEDWDEQVTVDRLDEQVVVPAGTFTNCARIARRADRRPRARDEAIPEWMRTKKPRDPSVDRLEMLLWYAPGVGMVKAALTVHGGPRPGVLTIQLTERERLDAAALDRFERQEAAREAVGNLGKIVHGAIAYFDVDHADSAGIPLPKCFPSNGGKPIRSHADLTTGCCPGPCADGTWTASDGDGNGWQALSFSIKGPHRYKYEFAGNCCRDNDCKGVGFTATAVGDLDCNGTTAVFTRRGRVKPDGEIETDKVQLDPARELE